MRSSALAFPIALAAILSLPGASAAAGPEPLLVVDETPSDAWITAATQTALQRAQGIESRIGSDVEDGVVLLHGTVRSEAEKTRAVALTSRVPGVRGIRDLLRVAAREDRDDALTDALVAGRVSMAFTYDQKLWDSRVGVHAVDGGAVILAGEVASPELHRRAIELASEVEGVGRVASLVRSSDPERDAELWEDTAPTEPPWDPSPASAALSDAGIVIRLKLKLFADPGLAPTRVDVDCDEGIVTLFGSVATEEQRDAALERSLEVDGVLFVDNDLQVVPPSVAETVEVVDARLEREIARRLEDEGLGDADISIAVSNATVRVEGVVSSHSDRLKAIGTVFYTSGVRGVSDGLEVASSG